MIETEMMSLPEMQDVVDKLKVGSAILYGVLQQVYELHDVTENEECAECKVAYPCNTAQILFSEFAVSQPDQPSEHQSEPDEPSDLPQ